MIITSVLRSVANVRAAFDGSAAIKAPFKKRFDHHLPRALGDGTSPAADDGARAAWWENGYRPRNLVVHEGERCEVALAQRAVEAAWDFADHVGRLLRDSDDTAALGALLRVMWNRAGGDETENGPAHRPRSAFWKGGVGQ
jgi:hypothetical protein